MNVIAAPGDVFDSVKASPPSTANWLAPALIFILVCWAGGWLVLSQESIRQQWRDITDKRVEQQIEKSKMSNAQAEATRRMAEKMGNISPVINAVALPVIVAFISPFWWGLILWLGAKVLKARCDFMKAVDVAGLANMVNVLSAIVEIPLKIGMNSAFATPSLVLLVKEFDPQNPAHFLLAVVNVMVLWTLGVRSFGLARLSGTSFGKAALWVFGIGAAFTALMVGFSFAMLAISRAMTGG